MLQACLRDTALCTQFTTALLRKIPQMHDTILSTLRPYVELMGLQENQYRRGAWLAGHADPVTRLWEFLGRLLYERPDLLQPDSLDGQRVLHVRERLPDFISELVLPLEPPAVSPP